MSFILFNNNLPQLNHKETALEFCKHYYNTFSNHGINGIMNLYHSNAQITFLEEECVGMIAYTQKLINSGLSKLIFNNLIGTTQSYNMDAIIINVIGDYSINNGINNNWNKFSDVFIINYINNNWIISHHIFKIIV